MRNMQTMHDRIRSIQPVRLPALLLCSAVLALGCKKQEATPTPEVYVQAAHPEQGSISEQITADATLTPLAQAAISPKVTAPVKKFLVQRGAHVKAGQLLATLENSDISAAAHVKAGQLLATLENSDISAAALDNEGAYT